MSKLSGQVSQIKRKKERVKFDPSTSQTMISFFVSHVPYHWYIFFLEIRYWPWWNETSGGDNTECISIRIECGKWWIPSCELLFVMPMKSSTNNYRILMNDAVSMSWWLLKYCDVSRMRLLKECSGILASFRRAYITPHAISEAAQNKGVDLHHSICRQFGTTRLILSIYLVVSKDGSTYPKFHASCSFTCRRQNPSLMSISTKRNGWLGL